MGMTLYQIVTQGRYRYRIVDFVWCKNTMKHILSRKKGKGTKKRRRGIVQQSFATLCTERRVSLLIVNWVMVSQVQPDDVPQVITEPARALLFALST